MINPFVWYHKTHWIIWLNRLSLLLWGLKSDNEHIGLSYEDCKDQSDSCAHDHYDSYKRCPYKRCLNWHSIILQLYPTDPIIRKSFIRIHAFPVNPHALYLCPCPLRRFGTRPCLFAWLGPALADADALLGSGRSALAADLTGEEWHWRREKMSAVGLAGEEWPHEDR